MLRRFSTRSIVAALAATAIVASATLLNDGSKPALLPPLVTAVPQPPTREEHLAKLASTKFDVLVIGGGATGTGTALDAQTRGLTTALLERTDFAAETLSKLTKMAHGGVRYLEKAVFQLSKAQLDLVVEALHERAHFIKAAPHLATVLPIIIPVYKYWQVPYFYAGTVMYDIFAGRQNLRRLYLLSKSATIAQAPMLDAGDLKALVVYHDGTFNDARMNASLALTAVEKGATILNYTEVKQLLKEDGKVVGVIAEDRETGKQYTVRATAVVNATGPFSDKILEMDNDPEGKPAAVEQAPKMVVPLSGVHVVFPEYFAPKNGFGLLDPATADGRVMFFLPWQGKCLAGTTDTPLSKVESNPKPTEEEIMDIIGEMQHYVKFPVHREDVLSAWSGIRPLVRDPSKVDPNEKAGSTQGIVRSHLVYETASGLTTISGGKWTTYREMAEDTVNHVVKKFDFGKPVKPCQTNDVILVGGENFEATLAPRVSQAYKVPIDLAEHLAANYGTRAPVLCEIYAQSEVNKLPVPLAGAHLSGAGVEATHAAFAHPFTVAELKYSMAHEYARTPVDFLARRTRLAFLDAKEALKSVDGVVQVMGDELGWSGAVRDQKRQEAVEFIERMV